MCFQSVIGVIISTCMVGIVFAKLSRPKNRSHTLMFSKDCVVNVNKEDNEMYLLFRVGNMRKSNIIESHVRAQVKVKQFRFNKPNFS